MSTPMAGQSQPGCDDQAEVIAFLSDPASYPTKPERVERFETHGALVFLAGEEAWKIKRAVRFPYLDFSTLEKRKAVCAREVEINRRLAPEIYLGCAPITRTGDGRLAFGGRGEIIEWAVRMRRFDQAALLSNVAKAGGLTPDLAGDLADIAFESHRAAERAANIHGADRIRRLLGSVGATLAGLEDAFNVDEIGRFRERAAVQLDRCAAVLEARASGGFVRRCHGDLHLRNIVLWRGRPVLFDAIEFDDELATIDTLYDLAFLLMDLDSGGHRGAANIVLNRYLWRSNKQLDLKGLKALPLFIGLRAGVRAMVTAERAEQEQGRRKADEIRSARTYLDAAIAYLAPSAPRLIAIGGLSGTGKSTLASALAPSVGSAPGAVHLRSDLERKSLFGVDEMVRLAPEAYTKAANDKVYATLSEKARTVLSAGHAVVVDAVHGTPVERAEIEALATGLGVPFQGLWLEAPPDRLIARVAARRRDVSDATPDVVRQQLAREIGPLTEGWARVDARGSTAQTLEKARDVLACSPTSAGAGR